MEGDPCGGAEVVATAPLCVALTVSRAGEECTRADQEKGLKLRVGKRGEGGSLLRGVRWSCEYHMHRGPGDRRGHLKRVR